MTTGRVYERRPRRGLCRPVTGPRHALGAPSVRRSIAPWGPTDAPPQRIERRRHAGGGRAGRCRVPYTLHPYEHAADAPAYGAEAADALGLSPDQVVKTLVARVDGRLVAARSR